MPATPDGGLALRLQSVYRDRWRRVFVLQGDIEAEIAYDARGVGESVHVNGELRGQTSGWAILPGLVTVTPSITFHLRGPVGAIAARIEVAVAWWFWRGFEHFRLLVDDQLLYEEKDGTIYLPVREDLEVYCPGP